MKLSFVLIFISSFAFAITPKEIMKKNEDARQLIDIEAKAKLVTSTASGDKSKEFTWWRRLKADKIHYDTFTRFHAPAEIKNEAFLFQENEGDKTDIQMYLPAYKKIRRVEPAQQSSSFMGSEFSFSDIASPHVDDYEYLSQVEETCPTKEFEKEKCYKVEMKPATEAVKERTGVGRTVAWVLKSNFMVSKSENYDLDGKLWKKLETSDIRQVDTVQKKWMAFKLRMENVIKNKQTLLEFADTKVNKGIAESIFTLQNLQKER